MIEALRTWLRRAQGRCDGYYDFSHLPEPVRPGNQPLATSRLIVLDLETSGLNPFRDQVIAIGAVAIDNRRIRLDDQFDLVLKRPDLNISETVLIHGIGTEALTRGHEIPSALLRLLEWMNGAPILAFRSDFDQRFLERALRQTLGYSRSHCWLDAAALMPALFPDKKAGAGHLDDWIDTFGLNVSERHHAAANALVTAELVLMALVHADKQQVTTLGSLQKKLAYHRRLQGVRRVR